MRRIPGAVHFDLDAIKDTNSPLPHMLPSAREFAAAVGALGIGDGMRIVEKGLAAGDRIVVNGLQRVRPGTVVDPQTEVAAAK